VGFAQDLKTVANAEQFSATGGMALYSFHHR
jgi:phosphoribosylamine-glycine ligase